MKKIRNNAAYFFKSIENSAAGLRAQSIIAVKEIFTSDIFRLLKNQNQNLEIVYANIRV